MFKFICNSEFWSVKGRLLMIHFTDFVKHANINSFTSKRRGS